MVHPAHRPRRSALFMPASNPRAIAKARTLSCDVVILDLEDAVAPGRKDEARRAAVAAIAEGGFGPREIVVRINPPGTDAGRADLAALRDARTAPDAVLIPKLADARTVADTRAALGDGPALWAMIESAAALLSLPTIVDAAPLGLIALVAGTNDLALDLRCRPDAARTPLLPALGQIVAAARAKGLIALDGVLNDLTDAARLDAECAQGRMWGFDGKTLIHPGQIDAANRAFSSTPEERRWAAAIVAIFEDPDHATLGAVRFEGAMVERLHLIEAQRILALADPA